MQDSQCEFRYENLFQKSLCNTVAFGYFCLCAYEPCSAAVILSVSQYLIRKNEVFTVFSTDAHMYVKPLNFYSDYSV